jgi:hypothetical protein
MGKLPKTEAWKQSDPHKGRTPTSPKVLEQRLSVGINKIPAELLWSSYEEGSRQFGRPSGPQSLTTLSTRIHLATTLSMRALQVESLKCDVCSDFH